MNRVIFKIKAVTNSFTAGYRLSYIKGYACLDEHQPNVVWWVGAVPNNLKAFEISEMITCN